VIAMGARRRRRIEDRASAVKRTSRRRESRTRERWVFETRNAWTTVPRGVATDARAERDGNARVVWLVRATRGDGVLRRGWWVNFTSRIARERWRAIRARARTRRVDDRSDG